MMSENRCGKFLQIMALMYFVYKKADYCIDKTIFIDYHNIIIYLNTKYRAFISYKFNGLWQYSKEQKV